MKSFTQFFNEEYIVLEDIQYMDKTIYKKIVNEESDLNDPEIEALNIVFKDKAKAKKYLENEEEDKLMKTYLADPTSKEGLDAREKVILNRVRFAKYLANRAVSGGVVPAEKAEYAYDAAMHGLFRAIDTWDPVKNNHFGPWAKEQIYWAIRNRTTPKRKKSVDERTHENTISSIDSPIEAGGYGKGDNNSDVKTIGDKIADPNTEIPGEDKSEIYALLNSFMSQLPDKELKAIKYYFYGDGNKKDTNGKNKGLTYDEIGKRLDMTKVGARSLVIRALTKLRKFMESHGVDAEVVFS